MKTHFFRNALALSLGVSLCFARPAAAQYTLTPLPANLTPTAVNINGQVLGCTSMVINSNEVFNFYLVTNGVSQPVAVSNDPFMYLNDKGQVAGIDSNGSLILYSDGVTRTLAVKGYSLSFVGLNNNGEVVWSVQSSATAPSQVFTYQNGVTQNLGTHKAFALNNLGQIAGHQEIYTNGAWQAFPNLPDSDKLDDRGQVSYHIEQAGTDAGFPVEYVTYGVYNLATNSSDILLFDSGNQYVPPPYSSPINLEGDYIGGKFANTGTSSNQHVGTGRSRGKQVGFGLIVNYPTQQMDPGDSIALNNNGDILGSMGYISSIPLGGGYYSLVANIFYNADSALYDSVTDFITGSTSNASYYGLLLNDRRNFVIQNESTSAFYLALPNGSVNGVVTLEGIAANAPAQAITFEFRNVLDTPLFTVTASVGPDGAYTLSNIATGMYHIRVKGDKYLAQIMTVNSSGGAVTGVNIALPGGDANNDNAVDTLDFNVLAGAFNTSASVPGSGYNAAADFNGDGFVDTLDFNLLIGEFGNQGDN